MDNHFVKEELLEKVIHNSLMKTQWQSVNLSKKSWGSFEGQLYLLIAGKVLYMIQLDSDAYLIYRFYHHGNKRDIYIFLGREWIFFLKEQKKGPDLLREWLQIKCGFVQLRSSFKFHCILCEHIIQMGCRYLDSSSSKTW